MEHKTIRETMKEKSKEVVPRPEQAFVNFPICLTGIGRVEFLCPCIGSVPVLYIKSNIKRQMYLLSAVLDGQNVTQQVEAKVSDNNFDGLNISMIKINADVQPGMLLSLAGDPSEELMVSFSMRSLIHG